MSGHLRERQSARDPQNRHLTINTSSDWSRVNETVININRSVLDVFELSPKTCCPFD